MGARIGYVVEQRVVFRHQVDDVSAYGAITAVREGGTDRPPPREAGFTWVAYPACYASAEEAGDQAVVLS